MPLAAILYICAAAAPVCDKAHAEETRRAEIAIVTACAPAGAAMLARIPADRLAGMTWRIACERGG